MLFNDLAPAHDEDLVYKTLSSLRDLSLGYGHSVIIDSTAPRHLTREYFLSGSNRSRHLVVVMDVDKNNPGAGEEGGQGGPLKAFEAVWQEPQHSLPFFKFKNDNAQQFETSYYLLMEYIKHEYVHHSGVIDSLFRRGRKEETIPEPRTAKPPPT